jgi:CO/xanthine dehydrogenase FAD-binding subunit
MLAAATRAVACRGVRHLASVGGDQMAAIKALRAASAAPIADVRSALVETGWNQGV